MKDTNKPQWLIDAENEIKNFEESEYGKLTDKEFKQSTKMINMKECANNSENWLKHAKEFGNQAVKNGYLNKAREINIKSGNAKKFGKILGDNAVKNSWLSKATIAAKGKGAKVMKQKASEDLKIFFNLLPNEFTQNDAYYYANKIGKSISWTKGILRNKIESLGYFKIKKEKSYIYKYSKDQS